ncbi:MAG: hypothetical protein ACW99A_16100 [Candidatus Kariarchaeaceae archaeon]|jgi:hypothetical protein
MVNSLLKLLKQEKVAGVKVSVLLAVIVSASVLAASFVAFQLLDNNNPGEDIDDLPDPSDIDYALALSSYMDQQFEDEKISAFKISGNATDSIHPNMISSLAVKTKSQYEVEAYVEEDPVDVVNKLSFSFTRFEMVDVHQSFVESVEQTQEVEEVVLINQLPSATLLLVYVVLYEDGTGFEFSWLGFDDINIMKIQNITWGSVQTTITSLPALSSMEQDYNYVSIGGIKYLSPLSAFDSFINKLQDLYSQYLGVL